MLLAERIKRLIKVNNPKRIAEGIGKTYDESDKEEELIDGTVDDIMNLIKEIPNKGKVKDLLKAVLEEESIPDKVFEKTVANISKLDGIPDEIVTNVVDKDMSDELINNIIKNGDFELSARMNLIEKVDNENILKDRINTELKILYRNSLDKTDTQIVDRIKDLKKILKDFDKDAEFKKLIYQIVAKKMAGNLYNDSLRGTRIYTLSQIMPVDEMIKEDLPSNVQIEFEKLEDDFGKKNGRFNKEELKNQILDEMARNVAYKFKDSNVFVIPQSTNMKKLTKDEEDMFINSIQKYADKKISEKKKKDIRNQIKGNGLQSSENQLIVSVKKLPKNQKNDTIDLFIKVLEDGDILDTVNQFEQTGLLDELKDIPKEKRDVLIETISDVVSQKKNKYVNNVEKENDDEIGDR